MNWLSRCNVLYFICIYLYICLYCFWIYWYIKSWRPVHQKKGHCRSLQCVVLGRVEAKLLQKETLVEEWILWNLKTTLNTYSRNEFSRPRQQMKFQQKKETPKCDRHHHHHQYCHHHQNENRNHHKEGYDAVSDLMHNWVAQRLDFKSALRVVKMVLNTQCFQYLRLSMWFHAKKSKKTLKNSKSLILQCKFGSRAQKWPKIVKKTDH